MPNVDPHAVDVGSHETTCASCGGAEEDVVPSGTIPGSFRVDGVGDDVVPSGTVLGSYRVHELLAKGGMGNIYVAEHLRLGRRVALKMLRAEFNANPSAVARFFAEARAVNKISHDNIVEITDFVENQDGHNYFIMPLLRGQDLGQLLFRSGVIPVVHAVDIALQVASGLAAVHAAQMVHRDLKPDNIFIVDHPSRPNFVKLLDFGVARFSDPDGIKVGTTCAGMVLGTPEYMSPEQACGLPVDHRTDIYALGVVLYEMVTGISPFKAKSFGETLMNHMNAAPIKPRARANLPHEIPQALEELILALLAKQAADRPQTMTEVEERLLDLQDELGPAPIADRSSARMRALRHSSQVPFAGEMIRTPSRAPTEASVMTVTRRWRARTAILVSAATALALATGVVALAAHADDSAVPAASTARPGAAAAPGTSSAATSTEAAAASSTTTSMAAPSAATSTAGPGASTAQPGASTSPGTSATTSTAGPGASTAGSSTAASTSTRSATTSQAEGTASSQSAATSSKHQRSKPSKRAKRGKQPAETRAAEPASQPSPATPSSPDLDSAFPR